MVRKRIKGLGFRTSFCFSLGILFILGLFFPLFCLVFHLAAQSYDWLPKNTVATVATRWLLLHPESVKQLGEPLLRKGYRLTGGVGDSLECHLWQWRGQYERTTCDKAHWIPSFQLPSQNHHTSWHACNSLFLSNLLSHWAMSKLCHQRGLSANFPR